MNNHVVNKEMKNSYKCVSNYVFNNDKAKSLNFLIVLSGIGIPGRKLLITFSLFVELLSTTIFPSDDES